jgi:fibronectin type 3 domain-containing protein
MQYIENSIPGNPSDWVEMVMEHAVVNALTGGWGRVGWAVKGFFGQVFKHLTKSNQAGNGLQDLGASPTGPQTFGRTRILLQDGVTTIFNTGIDLLLENPGTENPPVQIRSGHQLSWNTNSLPQGVPQPSASLFLDTVPPAIQLLNPTPGSAVGTPIPALLFTFQDQGSGIAPSTLAVRINGRKVSTGFVNITTGLYQLNVSHDDRLQQGQNLIEASITDFAGNTGQTSAALSVQSPPLAPDRPAVDRRGSQALVTWRPPGGPGIAGYQVYRAVTGPFVRLTGQPLTYPSFLDENAPNTATYRYAVSTVDFLGQESPLSPEMELRPLAGSLSRSPAPDPPGTPVIIPGDRKLTLTWTEPAGGAAGYFVEAAAGPGGPFNTINPGSPLMARSFEDSGLPNGVPRYYRLVALDPSYALTSPSGVAGGTPLDLPPSTPAGLTGFRQGAQVVLSWNKNPEEDIMGYRVYRSFEGGPPVLRTPQPVPGQTYIDALDSTGQYVYRLNALDFAGQESLLSEPILIFVGTAAQLQQRVLLPLVIKQ